MYNNLVERCFRECVDSFRRKDLDSTEEKVGFSPTHFLDMCSSAKVRDGRIISSMLTLVYLLMCSVFKIAAKSL